MAIRSKSEPETRPAAAEAMGAWRFSTADYPRAARRDAWREVLSRLRLPLGEPPEHGVGHDPFRGEVSCIVSPLGMDFALMSASPQAISGRNPNQPAAVWLAVLLKGEASFFDGETTAELDVGDIMYGPSGMNAALRLTTPFRLLFINAPRVALDHRLIAPLSLKVGRLPGGHGLGHIFSGLLRATADSLDEMTADQLRPIELALTEFLVAGLAAEGAPASRGGASAARAAHLHRVCQTIETMLADPELTLEKVADADGISPRSLQKLFAGAGQNFSTYLRHRRLERCRLDLTSPMFATLSISEICFRWGFNGSAHFSRAFKDRYGVSPRDYRKGHAADSSPDSSSPGASPADPRTP